MYVKGINYGLTLYYSYLLPLFEVEEVSGGFVFVKRRGTCSGLTCRFGKQSLETACRVPRACRLDEVEMLLGLRKRPLFHELGVATNSVGVVDQVTLMYTPGDRTAVAYSIYLSQNTDYHVNTVKWVRDLLERGSIESSSYQVSAFRLIKAGVDRSTSIGDPYAEAVSLLNVKGLGVKSAKAYLLHAYGLTEHAPVDRHYKRLLALSRDLRVPDKAWCAKVGLKCSTCPFSSRCLYGVLFNRLGAFNGVVQSLAFIAGSLERVGKDYFSRTLVGGFEYLSDLLRTVISSYLLGRFEDTTGSQCRG
ncbi:HhH-GPD family protein [Thermogladius calderae 1633]|uniref:HhH-GPD family protein n=1 Tax=Thermogladius calderae (strain DSM 22663 / VKM B-2946 / 1633) TaxID=1184251 RepID=I3TGA1_THEC1|nr:base excision DNA repair protein [Thermogladius calderae]AFK51789.1 HhH-GPD family protein [Thermogladius calderae 1633]